VSASTERQAAVCDPHLALTNPPALEIMRAFFIVVDGDMFRGAVVNGRRKVVNDIWPI